MYSCSNSSTSLDNQGNSNNNNSSNSDSSIIRFSNSFRRFLNNSTITAP